MAQPKVCNWVKIKRIARYLVKASRAVQKFAWQEKATQITTYVDSDWAGNKITRKSTVVEFNSTGRGIVERRGRALRYAQRSNPDQRAHLHDGGFWRKGSSYVCSHASVAIGIAHRQGLGKTRHVEVQYLWIQHEVKEGKLTVKKVGTNNNPADLLTEAMNGGKMMKYMAEMGFDIQQSRQYSSNATTADMLACSVTKGTRRPQRRALRPKGVVRTRPPDSESAVCASRVEKPNPTGDVHKWQQ